MIRVKKKDEEKEAEYVDETFPDKMEEGVSDF